jgi:hypothetical protein
MVLYFVIPILLTAVSIIFNYDAISLPDYWMNMSPFATEPKNKGGCHVTSPSSCLCIALFSGNQSDCLQLLLARLLEFITKAEPNLLYELLWINQERINAISFSRLHRFEKKFLFTKSVGRSVFIYLAFSQCDCGYLLPLDQDWLPTNMSLPWFSFSMDLLAHAPESMYAISLRVASLNSPIDRTKVKSCLVPSGTVWRFDHGTFRFVNGPVVYRMSSIRIIVAQSACVNEYGFALAAKNRGYNPSFWADGTVPPADIPTRFRHVKVCQNTYPKV